MLVSKSTSYIPANNYEEPLHGLTFALIQTASVSFIYSRCNENEVGEGQGLGALAQNTGSFLGTVIGSWVLQNLGSTTMYRLSALIVIASTIPLVYAFRKPMEQTDQGVLNEPIELNLVEEHLMDPTESTSSNSVDQT